MEGHIFTSAWGFELPDVEGKTMLFYGHEDTRTPVAFGRHLHAHLGGGSELYEFPHASHFSIYLHYEEIFGRLLGRNIPNGKVDGLERDPKHDDEIRGKFIGSRVRDG